MRANQSIFLKKNPNIKPTAWVNVGRKLYCLEITIEKHNFINIYFKTHGDMVNFIQKIARWIEPIGEK